MQVAFLGHSFSKALILLIKKYDPASINQIINRTLRVFLAE
jgi:hypothetical protein